MAIRAKTKRRVLILAAGCVLAVLVLSGLWVMRARHIKQAAFAARDRGLAEAKAGQYEKAALDLGAYLARYPGDAHTLYIYAEALKATSAGQPARIRKMLGVLHNVVSMDPANDAAKHELLTLYTQLGFKTEAKDLADLILADHPKDADAIDAKATVLQQMRDYKAALPLSQQYNDLKPMDLDGQVRTMQIMHDLKQPDKDMLQRAEAFEKAHPDDARAAWLMAFAEQAARNHDDAVRWIATAAKRPAPDDRFVLRLANLMDVLGQYGAAATQLQNGVKTFPESLDLRRTLARRLCEHGAFAELAGRLKDVTVADGDAELLGLKTLARYNLDSKADLAPALEALAARQEPTAQAWASVLRVVTGGHTGSDEAILAFKDAVAAAPRQPLFYSLLAQAYLHDGEPELALKQWKIAAQLDVSWGYPLVRTAQVMIAQHRYREGIRDARQALARMPNNLQVAATLAQAWAAAVREAQNPLPKQLCDLVTQIQTAVPGEKRTLDIWLRAKAQTGGKAEAQAALKQILAGAKAPGADVLLRLSNLSRELGLGLEQQCIDRLWKVYGATPGAAYAKAMLLARQGHVDEGKALLAGELAKSRAKDRQAWALAQASFLDRVGDPSAGGLWKKLTAQYADSRTVLQAAMSADSFWMDREAADQAITQLKRVTGEQSPAWRIARARWLLARDRSDATTGQATKLLNETISIDRGQFLPHVLLAQCYQRLGDLSSAVKQLNAAVAIDPGAVDVRMELAALSQAQGDTNKAERLIDRLLEYPNLTTVQRHRAAAVLASLGRVDQAVKVLQGLHAGQAAPPDLLLARLLLKRGEVDQASAILSQLLQKPTADVVRFAIAFYLQHRQPDKAAQVVGMLASMDLPEATRQTIEGDYHRRLGKAKEALKHYQLAAAAAPSRAHGWLTLIGYQVVIGDGAGAARTTDHAAAAVTHNDALNFLEAHRDLLAATAAHPELRDLALVMVGSSSDRETAAKAMQLIRDAGKSPANPEALAVRLRQLADANPRLLPLQLAVTRLYTAMHQPRKAAEVAQRTMQVLPEAPRPAMEAANAFAAAGNWNEALAAAQAWRDRMNGSKRQADLAIAQAQQNLGNPAAALAQVKPYLADALKDPDHQFLVIGAAVVGMIGSGQAADAHQLLEPLARKSQRWREVWIKTAVKGLPDAATATRWLNDVAAMMPADDPSEQLLLAQAWRSVDQRFHDPKATAQARTILAKLLRQPKPLVGAILTQAVVEDGTGNKAAAEAGYRKVLERQPNQAQALNNLAMILIGQNKKSAEALTLAQKAVELQPKVAAYRDTLARAQSDRGDFAAAVKNLEAAVALHPASIYWWMKLAQANVAAGDSAKAKASLEQIDALAQRHPKLPAELRTRIDKLRKAVGAG